MKNATQSSLKEHLRLLGLPFMHEHCEALARQADSDQWDHIHYLEHLALGELNARQDRSIRRKVRLARFPGSKTLNNFNGTGKKKSTD